MSENTMQAEIESGIIESLDSLWTEKFIELWERTVISDKTLSAEGLNMRVIHNNMRDHWEKTKKHTIEEKKECPFDSAEQEIGEKYFPYRKLLFSINTNPTLNKHLIIASRKHKSRADDWEEHHEIIRFVNSSDYCVFLNLKGSGAGIPEHLHFQGQKRDNFPLLERDYPSITRNILSGKVNITYIDLPNKCIRFEYGKEEHLGANVAARIDHVMEERNYSYNLIYDKNTLYFFPRSKEIATNIPDRLRLAGVNEWKIAGQEMGLLFTAKYHSIFDNASANDLYSILKEVSLNEGYDELEKAIITETKRLIDNFEMYK